MEKIKGYRIGLRATTDIEDGKQLAEPYYLIFAEYEGGSVWYDAEFNTLEEAKAYVQEKMMAPTIDKYKKLIEDEMFKATPDETIGFCKGLKTYMDELIKQSNYEKEQYK